MLVFVQCGDFTVTGGTYGTDYKYENNTLTILTSAELTISGTTTADKIVVGDGITANVTLSGVNIDVSGTSGAAALTVGDGSTLNLTLSDGTTNTLKSGEKCAGLQVGEGETVAASVPFSPSFSVRLLLFRLTPFTGVLTVTVQRAV